MAEKEKKQKRFEKSKGLAKKADSQLYRSHKKSSKYIVRSENKSGLWQDRVSAQGKETTKVEEYYKPVLIIGGTRSEHKMTSFEKIELIEEGISKKALENLKEQAKLQYDQLAKILNVARATLINKKGNEKFNKDVSDKILGLADIYSYGYEVFDDYDRFNAWIFRENQALGGQTPFDLLHNTFGREEVKNLIGRIDHGIYS